MTEPPADLLIVGAGPAGSATAIHAARAGLRVTLIDRARFPREKICAEYMSPEALRHLAQLDVLQRLDQAGGARVRGTRVVGPRGSSLTGLFARASHPPFRATGLSIPRRILDQVLVEQAASTGVTIHQGRTVTDLLYQQGAVAGVASRDSEGKVRLEHARLTVGADGLRSTVARRLGVDHHGAPARMAFVAHLAGVRGMGDQAELHVGEQGYVGLNPIGNGLTNVALVIPRRRAAAARGDPTGFFLDQVRSFERLRERLGSVDIVREVMVTGPFAARARRVVADGAMLVGDAADFFDPFTGEGICSGLRGAGLVARVAVEALAVPGIPSRARLKSYQIRRKAIFQGKWMVERLIGWGMFAPRLFDRAVGRLEARGWAHTFIGVTGDFVPASAVLNPRVLTGMLW